MNELVLANRAADWRRLKMLVLDSVSSPITKRVYNLGLDEFFEWFGREPRPGFTKATVSAWRVALEARGLGSISINVNSASAEILASAQQQAASTGEQAAAIQQTTTTMEEVAQSGVQISDRAKQVAASAEAASTASQAGLQAVENTTRTMENIRVQAEAVAENVVSLSEKTQAIGEIISTVNDLAEQSHLLALNAAIEAAAAGEHGRSFSVIASEVKNLADQSREATVQVRSILGGIQKGINTSVMLTEEAVKRVDSGKQQSGVADRTIREMPTKKFTGGKDIVKDRELLAGLARTLDDGGGATIENFSTLVDARLQRGPVGHGLLLALANECLIGEASPAGDDNLSPEQRQYKQQRARANARSRGTHDA